MVTGAQRPTRILFSEPAIGEAGLAGAERVLRSGWPETVVLAKAGP